MEEVKLTKHGNNANIKIHVLSDDEMVKAGFRKTNDGNWNKLRFLDEDISFDITIYQDGDWRIDVLEEEFLQPYDYQFILDKDPKFSFALNIKRRADEEMTKLIEAGIVSGWKIGDYL